MCPSISHFIFTTLCSWWADRLIKKGLGVIIVRKLFTGVGFFGCSIFIVLIVVPPFATVWQSVTFMTLAWAFAGFYKAGSYVNHFDIAPKYAGTLFGIINTFANLPGIIGVWLSGWMVDTTGSWTLVFVIPSLLNVVGGLLFLILGKGHILVE